MHVDLRAWWIALNWNMLTVLKTVCHIHWRGGNRNEQGSGYNLLQNFNHWHCYTCSFHQSGMQWLPKDRNQHTAGPRVSKVGGPLWGLAMLLVHSPMQCNPVQRGTAWSTPYAAITEWIHRDPSPKVFLVIWWGLTLQGSMWFLNESH